MSDIRHKRWLLLCVILLVSTVSVSLAQDDDTTTLVSDADNRFTIPVPENWLSEVDGNTVRVDSPEGDISVWFVAVETNPDGVLATVAEQWTIVLPDFDLEPAQSTDLPAPDGADSAVRVDYPVGEEIYQALAIEVGTTSYLTLISGNLEAVQRRNAQIVTIATGLEIAELQATDIADANAIPFTETEAELLTAFVEDLLVQFGLPGTAIAVVQNGEVVYSQGFGTTTVDNGNPITPTTHMMIGSTGKSLTTTMMAAMVDSDLFAWDTPAIEIDETFVFSNAEITESVTMLDMVCACSGVPRRDLDLFFVADLTPQDVVASLATFELFTDFGETFQYSNQMVASGGYLATLAAAPDATDYNAAYATVLNDTVLEPTGMIHTTIDFDAVIERSEYAFPHIIEPGYEFVAFSPDDERFLLPVAPAGTHWSTLEDMSRYMQLQLANGTLNDTTIVSAENLSVTRTGLVNIDADTRYGLGWFITDYNGIRQIGHGGNTVGFTSTFEFLPDRDLGVIVLSNSQGANAFGNLVVEFVFDTLFGVYDEAQTDEQIAFAVETARSSAMIPEGFSETIPTEEIEPYLGRWVSDDLGEIEITQDDNGIVTVVGANIEASMYRIDMDGNTVYIMGNPLFGLPIAFVTVEDTPVIQLGQGAIGTEFRSVDS